MEENTNQTFNVVLLGVIFDPSTKKILIGRQEGDKKLGTGFTWGFPGAYLKNEDHFDTILQETLKKKTGYQLKNLGAIFSKIYPENNKLLAIYFLCETIGGEMKAGEPFKELEWVNPEDLEKRFTTSFHKRLKEYIINLK